MLGQSISTVPELLLCTREDKKIVILYNEFFGLYILYSVFIVQAFFEYKLCITALLRYNLHDTVHRFKVYNYFKSILAYSVYFRNHTAHTFLCLAAFTHNVCRVCAGALISIPFMTEWYCVIWIYSIFFFLILVIVKYSFLPLIYNILSIHQLVDIWVISTF